MADKERDNFLHFYQNILLKENGCDDFETCSIRRKCLALAFQASLELSNNELSVNLLEEHLSSYASLVDARSSGKIDNYSVSSLALAYNCKSECLQWESSLNDAIAIPDTLRSNLECKCNQVLEEDIRKFVCHKGNASIETSTPQSNNGPISFDVEETTIYSKSNSISATNSTSNSIPTASGVNPKWQSSFTPKYSNFSKEPDYQVNRNGGINNKNSTSEWQKNPKANEFKTIRNEMRQPNASINNNSKNTPGPFRTAKQELGIQNQKKWSQGGQDNSNGRRFLQRTQKHLGTSRRPPVHDDFVLPVKQDPERGQSDFPEVEEDERLKGIDPKMVEMIKNDIIDSGTPVNWDDIAGLDFAKATIQEIVVWPLLRPDIFFGLRGPPKGILLFGPPGTGKTLIGKCIASQSKSTFFSISASSLTSKWIGEGEKMVRALFAVARCHPPAVIFIDEIDSLLSQRNETDHESSRRIKTEFLVQLDGAATAEEERILVIGATNRPQELDEAARRRLVKRLYIPLPESKARRQIIVKLMSNQRNNLSSEDIDEVAELTDGYSGADMKNLCREAALGPIRSIRFEDIEHIQPDQVRPVVLSDFKAALSQVRASVSSKDLDQYMTWNQQYGCVEAK